MQEWKTDPDKIIVKELDWKNTDLAEPYDIILASDIIWLESLVPVLIPMMIALFNKNPVAEMILSQ